MAYDPQDEGVKYVNLDITSTLSYAKMLSTIYTLRDMDSVLGFKYSQIRSVERYLHVESPEVFRALLAKPPAVAAKWYDVYLAANGPSTYLPNPRFIITFLLWERAKRDLCIRNALLDLHRLKEQNPDITTVCMNMRLNGRKAYLNHGNWYPRVVENVMNAIVNDERVVLTDATLPDPDDWLSYIPTTKATTEEVFQRVEASSYF